MFNHVEIHLQYSTTKASILSRFSFASAEAPHDPASHNPTFFSLLLGQSPPPPTYSICRIPNSPDMDSLINVGSTLGISLPLQLPARALAMPVFRPRPPVPFVPARYFGSHNLRSDHFHLLLTSRHGTSKMMLLCTVNRFSNIQLDAYTRKRDFSLASIPDLELFSGCMS